MRTFLFLDANFLAWRAFHAMGNLRYGAIKTGVIFGFLKDIDSLKERFGTSDIIFCFDRGIPNRRNLFRGYKLTRHTRHKNSNMTEDELDSRKQMREQVIKLRREYLPKIGYKNVFSQKGMEADDIIAALSYRLAPEDEAVIVSADADLFQLISENISIYNPNKQKLINKKAFRKLHGLDPALWWKVKMYCGCKSDEIPGIRGVGEVTAKKFILGILPKGSRAYKLVSKAPREMLTLNQSLVRLPFPGVRNFKIHKDEISKQGFNEVCLKLGLKSMMHKKSLGMSRASLF